MEFKKTHWIGIGISFLIIIFSFLLIGTKFFFLVIGVGILIGVFPFVFSIINEGRIATEKEEMFLEFARNLVESVKTGTPISKSIVNIKGKSYGVLSGNIKKLANQIALGIPMNFALEVFAKDINNKSISRAITLIGQAEKAGGDIGEILEAVAGAVTMSDKLKKERKATISALVNQGYIIFFVFMIIIFVMQFKILPMVSGISSSGASPLGAVGVTAGGGEQVDPEDISNAFFYLLLIQGFFTGFAIGKLSEGNIKAGVRHSFVLIMSAFLFSSIANIIFG